MSIERFTCKRDGLDIVGRLALPDGKTDCPLVIFSHGFGYNDKLLNLEKFAKNGIAACDFKAASEKGRYGHRHRQKYQKGGGTDRRISGYLRLSDT